MSDMKNRMMGRAQQAAQQGDLRRSRDRAAEAQSNEYDGVRWIALADIKADPRIQVRAGGLDHDVVQRYATIMFENQSYEPFPPLELYRAEGTEDLWLSAGYHRSAALELADQWLIEAGQAPIGGADAYIRPGGWQAAYWNAITDNLRHGKQMTTADLKNALYRLMGYDEPLPEDGEAAEYARMSNRQLASALGIGRTTVRNWLDEFQRKTEATGHKWPVAPQARVGADGREYDVSNIQAANALRAAREALAKLNLPPLVPGTPEHEQATELMRWLNTSLQDFKNMAGAGSRWRRWLPYALAAELDSAEPRVSYVNWMRAKLQKWQAEQEQARRAEEDRARKEAEQANARVAEKRDELIAAVLAVVEGQPPMAWREIEFAVNAHLKRIANRTLLSEAITAVKQKGLLRFNPADGRYALPPAPPAELSVNSLQIADAPASENGYQIAEPSAWLDTPASKGAPAHSDEDFRTLFAEFLNLGERVAQYIEIELVSDEPLPDWLREGLGTFAELLHGYAPGDDDVLNPGLNSLLADLNTRSRREKK